MNVCSNEALAKRAAQGIDRKDLSKLDGKVSVLSGRVELKLGGLLLGAFDRNRSPEVVDPANLDRLFQEVTAKTQEGEAPIPRAADIPNGDLKGSLHPAFQAKVGV